ncbi:MAG: DUF2283 domain-containing protein, partial [Deltaproteobacteria bacterium]|nr:DUF2283 domain-containing protein [Deltaproteobacteria bacterium]
RGTSREVFFMKITYSSDADICIIELKKGIPKDSIDLKEGIILHLDQAGNPLEIEILDASKLISLDEFSFSLPQKMVAESAEQTQAI